MDYWINGLVEEVARGAFGAHPVIHRSNNPPPCEKQIAIPFPIHLRCWVFLMKPLLPLFCFGGLSSLALADIHDPPMNDHGPTRKLGRGLANMLFGGSELFIVPNEINDREGNAAAWSYGPVRAIGRFFFRIGVGCYEVATFPFPSYRESYRPPYKLD